jgi:heme-degrading monooxygenase HmoA
LITFINRAHQKDKHTQNHSGIKKHKVFHEQKKYNEVIYYLIFEEEASTMVEN